MLRIFLQCSDDYFVNKFSNYVSNNYRDMEFICFSDFDKACVFYEQTKFRFSVIICEEQFAQNVAVKEKDILFVDDFTSFTNPDHSTINVYQSAHSIVSDIKSALALKGRKISGDTSIVSVFSTQGGGGKSTIAYSLALAAVRRGQQAMYLNFEEIPSSSQFYHHEFQRNIDNLIYKLQEGTEIAPIILETLERDEYGVSVLPPFHSVEDLFSLTEDNIENLLDALTRTANVRYIFVDLSNGFNKINQMLLKNSSSVLQVYSDSIQGREKMMRTSQDEYYLNLQISGAQLTVLNRAKTREEEVGIDIKLPNSNSLLNGDMVADVQNKNPLYLTTCTSLLDMIK